MPRKAKPVGDAAAGPEEGKRHPLNIRTTRELREQLGAAANRSGRSLAQEMEIRLEHSFADERLLGGAHNFAVARLIASALSAVETSLGQRWTESDLAKEACRGAAAKAIEIAFEKEAGDARAEYSRARDLGQFAATIADHEARNVEFQTAEWQELLDRARGALLSRSLANVGTLVPTVGTRANPKGLLAQRPPDPPPKPKTKRRTP
jgi:hypothetical protein